MLLLYDDEYSTEYLCPNCGEEIIIKNPNL